LIKFEEQYFSLPEHIVADAGYGSEQNYEDILTKRKRTPLITYAHLNEQKKKSKKDPFKRAIGCMMKKAMPIPVRTDNK
jgi:hypothetical protein